MLSHEKERVGDEFVALTEHSPTRDKGDFPGDFHGHKKGWTSSFPPCFLSFQAASPLRPTPCNVRNANAAFGGLKSLPPFILLSLIISRKETGTFFFCYCFCCGHRSRIFRRGKENNGRISWCLWEKKESLGIQGKTCVRKKDSPTHAKATLFFNCDFLQHAKSKCTGSEMRHTLVKL